MASRPTLVRIGIVAFFIAAVVVAIAWWPLPPPPERPAGNLEGASIGGPFTLLDETGATVTEASWPGQWRLLYFGFTHCPDICPTDVARMAEALNAFAAAAPQRAARVQPLFLTVDPARDTPEALAEFTDSFHPRLVGLTGSEEAVAAALKAFRIHAERTPGGTDADYLVDHAALFYLLAPDGRPVAFRSGMGSSAEDLRAMLDQHVH